MHELKFKIMSYFLKWFCEHELDQWEALKVRTKYGYVFITISRVADGSEENYIEL